MRMKVRGLKITNEGATEDGRLRVTFKVRTWYWLWLCIEAVFAYVKDLVL